MCFKFVRTWELLKLHISSSNGGGWSGHINIYVCMYVHTSVTTMFVDKKDVFIDLNHLKKDFFSLKGYFSL